MILTENELKNNGYQCADFFHSSKEEMKTIIREYDGIVIRSRFRMDEDFLQHAINLKFIARSGAGMENIDLEYCKKRNITCFNSPEGNADAVGEHAVAMLLSLFNNIILYNRLGQIFLNKMYHSRFFFVYYKFISFIL